jgi:hypothetical protein
VQDKLRNIFRIIERWLLLLAALIALGQGIWATYNLVSVHIVPLPMPSFMDVGRGALLAQAITVFFLIGSPSLLPPLREKPEFQNAIAASRQFEFLWGFVWVGFFFLYTIWWYYWPEISAGKESLTVHLVVDFFNLGIGALLFMCYLAMVLRTVPPAEFGWHRVMFLVFVLVVAFIVAEGLTANYFPDAPDTFGKQAYFDATQGLLSGVAIALLVGRLESRLIDSSRWIVAALYAYAVLQFAYPLLTLNDPKKAATFVFITSLALLLKVLLFFEFRRIIRSGTLTYYMFEYRRLFDSGFAERDLIMKDLLSS